MPRLVGRTICRGRSAGFRYRILYFYDYQNVCPLDVRISGALRTITDTVIRVHVDNFVYTPIENETEAELKTDAKDIFACEVTFADGSTEISEFLDTNYQPGDINNDGKEELLIYYRDGREIWL